MVLYVLVGACGGARCALGDIAPMCEVQEKPLLDVRHPKLSLQLGVQQMGVNSRDYPLIISTTSRREVPTVGWWWP